METATKVSYTVEQEYEGSYRVMCHESGFKDERVARVSRFMPGPMVSLTGSKLMPPAMARAVASAMVMLADELESTA